MNLGFEEISSSDEEDDLMDDSDDSYFSEKDNKKNKLINKIKDEFKIPLNKLLPRRFLFD